MNFKRVPPPMAKSCVLLTSKPGRQFDKEYMLVRGHDGSEWVQVFYSPNKMYSKGYWDDRRIYSVNYDDELRLLVEKNRNGLD